MANAEREQVRLDAFRARMRLFIAAMAVFVLLLGLTLMTFLIMVLERDTTEAMMFFLPFFLVGLLFFAASAFIDLAVLKIFMDYLGNMGRSRP